MLNKGTILDASGVPLNGRYSTLSESRAETWSAGELIRLAHEHPPEPVIIGLINKGDIFLLHGSEESFKSVFILQVAESLALGTSLLMYWNVPRSWRVGVIETEIHEVMLGERLQKMFPKGNAPKGMCFMRESALRDWRRRGLRRKFESIQKWIEEEGIEVLLIDTANDFFRGADNPSAETDVGTFFDELRSLKVGARGIVRHDRKKKAELDDLVNSNERIRGSAEWKEDPEVIVSLERVDRRTHQVDFEVGKQRYGRKPQPFSLWFDVETFRLTPLPPVIAVLWEKESTRGRIIAACAERFGLSDRTVDQMIAEAKEKTYLTEKQVGHEKVFAIDVDHSLQAPWFHFLFGE
jgi:hypothetical protein